MTEDEIQIGSDVRIIKTTRVGAGAGTWVCGHMNDHRFDALVFPEHAENREWELGDSQITKLFIKQLADGQTVFNWDRGPDREASDEPTECIVDCLCEYLAGEIYGGWPSHD